MWIWLEATAYQLVCHHTDEAPVRAFTYMATRIEQSKEDSEAYGMIQLMVISNEKFCLFMP